MPSYAIVGASRGIGLGFVRQLCKDENNTVFALVRDKNRASHLQEITNAASYGNVHAVEADLDDYRSLKVAVKQVSDRTGGKLDVLVINGAAFVHERSTLNITDFPDEETLEKDLTQFFKTNVVGTTHAINAFLPLIRAGSLKKIIAMSTGVSLPQYVLASQFGNNVAYSISKAGMNMAIAKFAVTVKDVIFLAVTPGFVKTMQGPEDEVNARYEAVTAQLRQANPNFVGPVSVDEAVNEMLALFEKLTLAQSGQFLRRDGKEGGLADIQPTT